MEPKVKLRRNPSCRDVRERFTMLWRQKCPPRLFKPSLTKKLGRVLRGSEALQRWENFPRAKHTLSIDILGPVLGTARTATATRTRVKAYSTRQLKLNTKDKTDRQTDRHFKYTKHTHGSSSSLLGDRTLLVYSRNSATKKQQLELAVGQQSISPGL